MHNRPRLIIEGLLGSTAKVLPSFRAGTSSFNPSLTVIGPFTVDISHAGSRPTIFASKAREHSSELAILNAEPVSAMYRRGPRNVEAAHGLKKAFTCLLSGRQHNCLHLDRFVSIVCEVVFVNGCAVLASLLSHDSDGQN